MTSLKQVLLVALCLALTIAAYRLNERIKERPLSRAWAAFGWVAALAGAVGFSMAWYLYDERTRIWGFPFPAAALQQGSDGVWRDFVGLTTLPFTLANAAIGGILGYGAVNAWAVKTRGKRHEAQQPGA